MLSKNIYNSRHNSPNVKKNIEQDIRYNSANLLSSSEEPSDYQLKNIIINGQKTQRTKSNPYYPYRQITPLLSEQSCQLDEKINTDLNQLKNQINLHRDAVEKANKLIQALNQQNYQLTRRLKQTQNQLHDIQLHYEEKLEKANILIQQLEGKCSRNQTAANSFIQYSKPSKTTPVRIYGRTQDGTNIYLTEGQSSVLQQISKFILVNSMSKLENQLSNLEELTLRQTEQVQSAVQQNKYMQAYIQDQFLDMRSSNLQFTAKFGQLSNQTQSYIDELKNDKEYRIKNKKICELLQSYRREVDQWRNYAATLQKQLNQYIKFVEGVYSRKKTPKKSKIYTNEDLLQFIVKDILKIFNKNYQKSNKQIKELHEILKDLFDQIKKNQWKFVNVDKVKLP